jgi:adenylate kinase family enzyme
MEIMKRVLIIGCSGSGKSTLAGKLAELTNLPVLNLDQLYWKPSWTIPDEKEWLASLTRALEEAGWIMDGHYSATLSTRLERADTVILLDFPTRICVFRAFSRMLRNHGNTRSDMANNCPEKLDWEFLKYVWTFRRRMLPQAMKQLNAFRGQLIVLRTPGEVRRFLDGFASGKEMVPAR